MSENQVNMTGMKNADLTSARIENNFPKIAPKNIGVWISRYIRRRICVCSCREDGIAKKGVKRMKNADEKEQAYPDIAYEIAKQNTCQNENGTPVISKDDECTEETEWDDLFEEMKRTL